MSIFGECLQTGVANIEDLEPPIWVPARTSMWVEICQPVSEQLHAIAANWKRASRDLAAQQYARTGGVLILPIVVNGSVKQLTVAADVRAAIHHAYCLLLDPDRDYGRMLCRCQLPSCGRYFFEYKPATGRPRRLFHSDECMKAMHDASGVERVRKSRAKRAARKPK